jgi:ABC-2 type transport system permease protein
MIHLRSIFAIARKDALDILFNKATIMMLLTPVLLSLLFAGVSGLLVGQPNTLLVYNPQHSRLGQLVSQSFPGAKTVLASSPGEVTSAFAGDPGSKSPPYTLGLVIPPGFDASLQQGEHPQVRLYFNDSQVTDLQRQRVVTTITTYASGVSHALPTVIITPATSIPTTSLYTMDLNTFFVTLALLTSINVGISLVSTLLVEEKEKRTLRLLLVSPATLTDVALAKLLVGVVYQVLLSLVVLALLHGFVGNLPLVLLFVLLANCFGLALSLLAGSIFHTTSGLGGFLGIVGLLFIIPTVFASPLGAFFANALLLGILHLLPTYYMAAGLLDALQGQSMVSSTLLDIAITITWAAVCLTTAVFLLHRQTAVTASI